MRAAAPAETERGPCAHARRVASADARSPPDDALVGGRNANRLDDALEARSVTAAIEALSVLDSPGGDVAAGTPGKAPAEAHPEKRQKAAFAAYEEAEMPGLMEEKPGLRRQQYRDMLFKAWQKDPRNPTVAANAAAATRSAALTSGGGGGE